MSWVVADNTKRKRHLRKVGIYKKEEKQTKLFPGVLRAIPFSGAGMAWGCKKKWKYKYKCILDVIAEVCV
jgi:hypothetical protein